MFEMTHKERVLNALDHKPVDKLPCGDTLWPETKKRYIDEGHMVDDEDDTIHFDMSWRRGGWIDSMTNLDFEDVVIEETDENTLILDGNGAQLRNWKNKSGTPEHVDFSVKERSSWEKDIKPFLLNIDRRRIPFESYRTQKALAKEEKRAFFWNGVAPFEQMHPVCGHEFLLMGMALDPDWVKDMVMTYADFTIRHLELLFDEEGIPDAMWYNEDMGFKERPFMSPAMYGEIILPGHKLLFDHAHNLGLKVVVHSCGFVEPLIPGMIEAGIDCLQAMEVKAGMDVTCIAKDYGDKIAFCGNIDIREAESNNFERIDAELNKKIKPVLDMNGGYMLASDHSIPPGVNHGTLHYLFEHGCRVNG